MKEEKLALAYAKSICQLCEESNIDVATELGKIDDLITNNNDLENLLFLDIFTIDEKKEVLDVILKRLETPKILVNFFNYLLTERRMGLFPMVYKEVIIADDIKKGIIKATVEGATESLEKDFEKIISSYLKKETGKEAELSYRQSDRILAGHKVTFDDMQLDASLLKQLESFKKSVIGFMEK